MTIEEKIKLYFVDVEQITKKEGSKEEFSSLLKNYVKTLKYCIQDKTFRFLLKSELESKAILYYKKVFQIKKDTLYDPHLQKFITEVLNYGDTYKINFTDNTYEEIVIL